MSHRTYDKWFSAANHRTPVTSEVCIKPRSSLRDYVKRGISSDSREPDTETASTIPGQRYRIDNLISKHKELVSAAEAIRESPFCRM